MIERRLVSRPVSTLGTLIAPNRTQEQGPPIVSAGLVGHWDAGNPYSYPSSGTTWTDLKGNSDGTLTQGPTFSTEAGGAISFDGTDDYVSLTSVSAFNPASINLSIETVFYFNGSSQITAILSNRLDAAIPQQYDFGIGGANKDDWAFGTAGSTLHAFFLSDTTTPGRWRSPRYTLPSAGIYHAIGISRSASAVLYVNGVLRSTDTTTVGTTFGTSGKSIAFGKIGGLSQWYFGSRIHLIRIYDRELTESEVWQNYQSVRWRFGI